MITVLLVTRDADVFADFSRALTAEDDVTLLRATSWEDTLPRISEELFDLVVVDETLEHLTGMAFVEKLVAYNPMLNSALVSRLPHDEFHEASEGLGVLAQLPKSPGKADALSLLDQVRKIKKMTAGVTGKG